MFDKIEEYISELRTALDYLSFQEIKNLSDLLLEAVKNNSNIFVMGNGGSASTASHMVVDLGRRSDVKIVCLNDNIATVTAYANDYGYESIFAQQLVNLVEPNDLVIVISASGNSENIINVLNFAKKKKAKTACLLGFDGGKAASIADLSVIVPSQDYGIVEDVHLTINHILARSLDISLDISLEV